MVANNLFKLVNVIDVQDATHEPSVTRDLALIKVKATPQTLFELNQMVDIYKAKVVDLCAESVIIEVTGPESKIESVVGMLKPYGILEMVRTGLVAMVRGSGYFSGLPSAEENGNE
jgi:acetolactate synthase-1/3 small subunit